MEPTIYKPSIYKGAGIYKAGAEGGGDIPEGLEFYQNLVITGKTNYSDNERIIIPISGTNANLTFTAIGEWDINTDGAEIGMGCFNSNAISVGDFSIRYGVTSSIFWHNGSNYEGHEYVATSAYIGKKLTLRLKNEDFKCLTTSACFPNYGWGVQNLDNLYFPNRRADDGAIEKIEHYTIMKDNNLLLNLFPAKLYGECGLFDMVSKEFYHAQNSGQFQVEYRIG